MPERFPYPLHRPDVPIDQAYRVAQGIWEIIIGRKQKRKSEEGNFKNAFWKKTRQVKPHFQFARFKAFPDRRQQPEPNKQIKH
jgi:hypothetical protein